MATYSDDAQRRLDQESGRGLDRREEARQRIAAHHEEMRLERSRKMIADPDLWPMWPRLPLKRVGHAGGDKDYGYLIDRSLLSGLAYEAPFVVHIGLIFDKASVETVTYGDVEALLAEWRID